MATIVGSASGTIDGASKPGISDRISPTAFAGAFISTYFLCLAATTEVIIVTDWSTSAISAAPRWRTSAACDASRSMTGRNPLSRIVEPEEIRSTTASAMSSLGATSTDPRRGIVRTVTPLSPKKPAAVLGCEVATRSPSKSATESIGLPLGTAAARRQWP